MAAVATGRPAALTPNISYVNDKGFTVVISPNALTLIAGGVRSLEPIHITTAITATIISIDGCCGE